MRINVYPTWQTVESQELKESIAIVIDVLRASNTIITALSNGAKEIIPVSEIDIAWQVKKEKSSYLLGGERGSQKIPGFDLGNSPLEYLPEIIGDKGIIFSTSNGSRALNVSSTAHTVLVASLANTSIVTTFLTPTNRDINIVCAGTLGTPSLEDTLAAGKIINGVLSQRPQLVLNDYGYLALGAYNNFKEDIYQAISLSKNGQKLIALDMVADIEYCSQVDTKPIIPTFIQGTIIPLKNI